MADRRPLVRRSKAQTRRLMLDAGRELAHERIDGDAPAEPLGWVRISDVVERATEIQRREKPDAKPVTTGSLYPIWPDQQAYQLDLALDLLGDDHLGAPPDWHEITEYLEQTTDDQDTVVARLTRDLWDQARHSPNAVITLGQLAHSGDDAVAAGLAAHYDHLMKVIVPTFQLACTRFNLLPRPGNTFPDFARVMIAMLDGFAAQHRAATDAVADADDRHIDRFGAEWSLVGQAAVVLFDAWFEPRQPAG